MQIDFRPLWIFRFFTVFIRNSFTGPYRAFCEGHFHPNRSFFFSDLNFFFSAREVGGSNQHYRKGQVRPKIHPKLMVCASERYSRKYPQVSSFYIFGPVTEIIMVVSQTVPPLRRSYTPLVLLAVGGGWS